MVRAGRWPGSDWLLRASHHRCLAEGDNLWDRVAPGAGVGEVRFSRPARPGRPSRPVVRTGRAKRGTWRPPGGELVTVTARRAREAAPPAGGEPRDWRLLTHRPADTLGPAAERLQWYGSRWRLAVVVRIFKPGGRVEAGQLSTLERLEPALALSLLLAGRSQYRTLLGRATPALPGEAVLDPAEGHAVSVASHRRPPPVTPPPLAVMLGWIARLGGHLGRKHYGPPGPNALWLGVQRARDVAWGRQLMSDIPSYSTA